MELKLRCLQLDLARQKERLDFIESYADFAAENGYNALVLYLENAVRTASTPFFDEKETYSAEEIEHIVDYAEARGLDVIPALENLGHLEKFFMYPQLADLSEISDYQTEGRGFDHYKRGSCGCITNPKLRSFTDRYIEEVCALFHSKYVHMGLDEPFDLAVCDRCKAALGKGADKAGLFLEHILHTYALCKKMGRTMMMWDDFFEYADIVEKLPRDIILCNWNYVFVGDEPQGHWVNRIKKDWFRLYDELGFSYLFCVYAHRASSAYNVDTFTAYAEKYHPMGAIMTAWRRSDSFYQGAYPQIAYAGAKWTGKVRTPEDRVSAYAAALGGSRACAELLLSMNIVEVGGFGNVAKVCENDYMIKLMYRDALRPARAALARFASEAEGSVRDILTDIWDYVSEIALILRMQKLGTEIFDGYEISPSRREAVLRELDEIEKGFARIHENGRALWKKYREGIKSCRDAFEQKFASYGEKIAAIRRSAAEAGETSVLYVDLMLHDPYPTVRNEIRAVYGSEERCIYRGSLKPTIAQFETGGCYGYRFALDEQRPDAIIFSSWGEGAIYPLHFRIVSGGKKYVADSVRVLCGKVENAQNILTDDTRFASMGEEDGIAHFNDIELSRERHEIRISFRPLA